MPGERSMSKHQSIATLCFCLLTAAFVSACDPAASVLESVRRPTSLCTDMGDGHCPHPNTNPDDIKPN
jgi:hypothetical protein